MITGNLRNVLKRRVTAEGIVYYGSPLLEAAGVPHAFSTRIGGGAGTSPPPFDSFNLGNPSGVAEQDDYERIYRHYKALQNAVGAAGRTRCWVHQMHGGNVIAIRRGDAFASGPEADAMVSDDPTRILSVRTADCVPVLMASSDGQVVAAVHSGWRGIIAGVTRNAIEKMGSRKIFAAIGPCISVDAYEVGPEVLAQFTATFGDGAPIRGSTNGKGHVDLREAIRQQLLGCGLRSDQIDMTDRCVFRDAGEFYSHRRSQRETGGVTGRMAAIISPRAS